MIPLLGYRATIEIYYDVEDYGSFEEDLEGNVVIHLSEDSAKAYFIEDVARGNFKIIMEPVYEQTSV